jgi:ubiquinone/menaquinone biosynthesis C-methylase UbiE
VKDERTVEWYEIAFGRIYPILYQHRDDDEAEMVLDAFGDLIEDRDPVLDLACGNGRYMISADKRGLRTWGVDLSEFLLGEAADRGLSGRLVRADMRRLPFGDNQISAVLNMFTSFGYFAADMDNLLVFREISRVLRTGGMLLFDYINAVRTRTMVLEDTMREVDGWVVRESRSLGTNGRFLIKAVEAENPSTGDTVAYEERVRLYTRAELTTMMESVFLVVSGVFGDYDLSDYVEAESDRIIMICEKR